jgi:hypothetical protein
MTEAFVKAVSFAGNRHPNQDGYGWESGVYWVLDGATRDEAAAVEDYVAKLSAELKRAVKTSPDDISLPHLLAQAISRAAHLSSEAGIPSATVAMARETTDVYEWLVLGDAVVCSEVSMVTDGRLLDVAKEKRDQFLTLRGDVGASAAQLKEAHATLLKEEDWWRNRAGGFWVAAGDPEAATHAVTGQWEKTSNLALLTDGADELMSQFLRQTDAALMFAEWQTTGMTEVLETQRGKAVVSGRPVDDATILYLQQ